jgi:hypothetical protein
MALLCRVSLALALTALLPAAAEPWIDYSSNGQATGVLHDTGYRMNVLEAVWTKYRVSLLRRVENYKGFMVAKKQGAYQLEEQVGFAMYVALNYIHQYPTVASYSQFKAFGRSRKSMSKTTFYSQAVTVMVELARLIDEVHYSDRLHPDSHGTGFFRRYFTVIVDCAPVMVQDCIRTFWRDQLFQGKYHAPCFKIQIGINFLGWIVLYTGLHIGTNNDDVIWESTAGQFPIEEEEWWIGDGAYERCYGVVCKLCADSNTVLYPHEIYFNSLLNYWRQRVEHTMHLIKSHGMWRAEKARNSHICLHLAMKLTVHLTNMNIKLNAPYHTALGGEDGPRCRYEGFSQGPHW